MQVSFALGYAGLLQNVGGLLRSVLVDSTKGTDSAFEEVALWTARPSNAPVAPITDQPRRRYYFRRMHEIMQVLSITCVVIGVIGNRAIIADREKPTKSTTNQAMRYAQSRNSLRCRLHYHGTKLDVQILCLCNNVMYQSLDNSSRCLESDDHTPCQQKGHDLHHRIGFSFGERALAWISI